MYAFGSGCNQLSVPADVVGMVIWAILEELVFLGVRIGLFNCIPKVKLLAEGFLLKNWPYMESWSPRELELTGMRLVPNPTIPETPLLEPRRSDGTPTDACWSLTTTTK